MSLCSYVYDLRENPLEEKDQAEVRTESQDAQTRPDAPDLEVPLQKPVTPVTTRKKNPVPKTAMACSTIPVMNQNHEESHTQGNVSL